MHPAKLLLPVVLAGGAHAQSLLSDSNCSKLGALLSQATGKTLQATVVAVKPEINFAFRFYAGYSAEIPLRQFGGPEASVAVLTRVTPADGSRPPACFSQSESFDPRRVAAFGNDLTVDGGFFLGTGRYRVDLAVADPSGRLHRKGMTFTAWQKGAERHMHLALRPGEIEPVEQMSWTPHAQAAAGARRRLTVLFHAASLYGPRTSLRAYDLALLLSSLSTVLSTCNFDRVRLIAFNIDQQRELFRADPLDVDGFHKLVGTLQSLRLWTVQASSLEPQTPVLDSLLRAELATERSADAVLILGPRVRGEFRLIGLPCRSGNSGPRLLYFQQRVDAAYDIWKGVPVRPQELPDAIERVVRACSGEVYRIHNPAELAAAIEKFNAKE